MTHPTKKKRDVRSEKKRNPQDATLRNINALKRRVSVLEKQMQMILAAAHDHAESKVEHIVKILEAKS